MAGSGAELMKGSLPVYSRDGEEIEALRKQKGDESQGAVRAGGWRQRQRPGKVSLMIITGLHAIGVVREGGVIGTDCENRV